MLWHERRYYSVDSYLKTTYGEKIYKISLDGGMSCPNRDGTLDTRGCIFCSAGGSGDFAADRRLSITQQIEQGRLQSAAKRRTDGNSHFIAYFQAYTNTYASPEYLRRIFMEAASHPDITLLSIATRPDCLSDEILELLTDIQRIKPVWIELGLQTIHDETAAFIRRGYAYEVFEQAVDALSIRNIPIIVHTILGLPGESTRQMIQTVDTVCRLPIFGIKLQLLHILKGTDLAAIYENEPFKLFTEEEYVQLIVELIRRIPHDITIHRMTGDGPENLLIAPLWSLDKRRILNDINKSLKRLDIWQGKNL